MTLERIGDTYSPRGAGGRREERGANRANTPPHWGGRRGDTPPRRNWKRADTPPKREASPPRRSWADDSPSPPRSWREREGQSSPGPGRRRASPRNWRDRRGDTPPRSDTVPRGKVYVWSGVRAEVFLLATSGTGGTRGRRARGTRWAPRGGP